jgi:hypothetical protein
MGLVPIIYIYIYIYGSDKRPTIVWLPFRAVLGHAVIHTVQCWDKRLTSSASSGEGDAGRGSKLGGPVNHTVWFTVKHAGRRSEAYRAAQRSVPAAQ